MLYYYPKDGTENYGTKPYQPLLQYLKSEVEAWDANQYITSEVEKFCIDRLIRGGFKPKEEMNFATDAQEHKLAYLHLRNDMLRFLQEGGFLPMVEVPRGARQWIEK